MSTQNTGFSSLFDIAVVGAGPAGLAAAVSAAQIGRTVALIDAGVQIGGQYWRHPDENHPRGEESAGHHDWRQFASLRQCFSEHCDNGTINYYRGTQVWFIEAPEQNDEPRGSRRTLHLAPAAAVAEFCAPATISADTLILCPGGYDRQLPIPGWDLPGVMAAGGVQALLKGHRTLAGRRAIVAGTGPFLLPAATQLAVAGAEVLALCEANHVTAWARHAKAVAAVPQKILEGAGYAVALARHRIPVRTGAVVTRILPDDTGCQVGSVQVSRLDRDGVHRGPSWTYAADLVALGWGFTPSLELVTAVGADTKLDADQSLVAVVDEDQRTTVPGVYAAGEATGVGGAALAAAEGELAGLAAAGAGVAYQRVVAKLQRRIRRHRAFAAAMHAVHPVPPGWSGWLTGDTTICRCEEIDYRTILFARDELGATDARTVKILARPGMGWCQGRVCGFATAALAAGDRPLSTDDLRSTARQPLCAPIALSRLASSLEGRRRTGMFVSDP